MIFVRSLILSLVTAAGAVSPAMAMAVPGLPLMDQAVYPHDRNGQDEDDRQSQARARGIVSGAVVGVDYAHGILRLATSRGTLDIIVQPGTSIARRGDQYGTIADLVPGARVAVYVSQAGGRLIAELIRIR